MTDNIILVAKSAGIVVVEEALYQNLKNLS